MEIFCEIIHKLGEKIKESFWQLLYILFSRQIEDTVRRPSFRISGLFSWYFKHSKSNFRSVSNSATKHKMEVRVSDIDTFHRRVGRVNRKFYYQWVLFSVELVANTSAHRFATISTENIKEIYTHWYCEIFNWPLTSPWFPQNEDSCQGQGPGQGLCSLDPHIFSPSIFDNYLP